MQVHFVDYLQNKALTQRAVSSQVELSVGDAYVHGELLAQVDMSVGEDASVQAGLLVRALQI